MAQARRPRAAQPTSRTRPPLAVLRARRRRRLRVVKAAIGVVTLLTLAAILGVAGVHTVADIVNRDNSTGLERYIGGNGWRQESTAGRFRAVFPSQPRAGREAIHILGRTFHAQRCLSAVPPQNGSVDVVWFDFRRQGPVKDPAGLLAAISTFVAKDLDGVPSRARVVPQSDPPAYEFTVAAKPGANRGDYHVRAVLSGGRIYLLRVQSRADNDHVAGALTTLADSFTIVANPKPKQRCESAAPR